MNELKENQIRRLIRAAKRDFEMQDAPHPGLHRTMEDFLVDRIYEYYEGGDKPIDQDDLSDMV